MTSAHAGRCLHEASPFLVPCRLQRPVMQRVRSMSMRLLEAKTTVAESSWGFTG